MRQVIFRILAGLVGVMFFAGLLLSPDKLKLDNEPVTRKIGMIVMMGVFLVYAFLGNHPLVDKLLGFFSPLPTKKEEKSNEESRDKTSE